MESVAAVNGVEIAYETFGDPADETMLLIMGLGVQMLGWDEELCRMLAGHGYRVVRFDNRDVGHSTQVEGGSRTAALTGSPTAATRIRRPACSSSGRTRRAGPGNPAVAFNASAAVAGVQNVATYVGRFTPVWTNAQSGKFRCCQNPTRP